MTNPFESAENSKLSEQVVIEQLDANEFEAQEAIDIARRYADQCHLEADQEVQTDPENPDTPNRANIKAEIKIALVYFKSDKYKEKGVESLEEALFSAGQSTATTDLAKQIASILDAR